MSQGSMNDGDLAAQFMKLKLPNVPKAAPSRGKGKARGSKAGKTDAVSSLSSQLIDLSDHEVIKELVKAGSVPKKLAMGAIKISELMIVLGIVAVCAGAVFVQMVHTLHEYEYGKSLLRLMYQIFNNRLPKTGEHKRLEDKCPDSAEKKNDDSERERVFQGISPSSSIDWSAEMFAIALRLQLVRITLSSNVVYKSMAKIINSLTSVPSVFTITEANQKSTAQTADMKTFAKDAAKKIKQKATVAGVLDKLARMKPIKGTTFEIGKDLEDQHRVLTLIWDAFVQAQCEKEKILKEYQDLIDEPSRLEKQAREAAAQRQLELKTRLTGLRDDLGGKLKRVLEEGEVRDAFIEKLKEANNGSYEGFLKFEVDQQEAITQHLKTIDANLENAATFEQEIQAQAADAQKKIDAITAKKDEFLAWYAQTQARYEEERKKAAAAQEELEKAEAAWKKEGESVEVKITQADMTVGPYFGPQGHLVMFGPETGNLIRIEFKHDRHIAQYDIGDVIIDVQNAKNGYFVGKKADESIVPLTSFAYKYLIQKSVGFLANGKGAPEVTLKALYNLSTKSSSEKMKVTYHPPPKEEDVEVMEIPPPQKILEPMVPQVPEIVQNSFILLGGAVKQILLVNLRAIYKLREDEEKILFDFINMDNAGLVNMQTYALFTGTFTQDVLSSGFVGIHVPDPQKKPSFTIRAYSHLDPRIFVEAAANIQFHPLPLPTPIADAEMGTVIMDVAKDVNLPPDGQKLVEQLGEAAGNELLAIVGVEPAPAPAPAPAPTPAPLPAPLPTFKFPNRASIPKTTAQFKRRHANHPSIQRYELARAHTEANKNVILPEFPKLASSYVLLLNSVIKEREGGKRQILHIKRELVEYAKQKEKLLTIVQERQEKAERTGRPQLLFPLKRTKKERGRERERSRSPGRRVTSK